ncbi:hypothetical protein KQY27_02470 [Methanobrevibacter sp. TMH8]|uniref:hypothetical protein n=1 Tax=Methanobrevibacter sp. TMH8 TaxID=2848611 RepID=UPI001CCDF239|nr:hypothetical protein [Methanobrevibacter sp. TMH8]MBZ9570408.1 hypothetical protein [Methanobrevibacter sp. TMH8]
MNKQKIKQKIGGEIIVRYVSSDRVIYHWCKNCSEYPEEKDIVDEIRAKPLGKAWPCEECLNNEKTHRCRQ